MMQASRYSALPPIVMQLLIANVALFLITMVVQVPIAGYLALWPVQSPLFMPWQILTYGFLHAGLGHLFFNMFALWMFGSTLERTWGSKRFLSFYLICVVGAGIIQLLVLFLMGSNYPTIGASGGVFGILLGFGMMYPNERIMLLIPPMPVKAKYFVIGYGALTLFFGITGTQAGVAHFAHLGGMLFGYLTIVYWRRPRQR
jgi:membrane associated rhomboid family serine protease